MVYAFLLVFGGIFLLRKTTEGINRYDLLLAWGLKIVSGILFLYIYMHYYGKGDLTADSKTFMMDAKILHDVVYQSPADYLRFLVGLDSYDLVVTYMMDTLHWSAGELTLINDSKNVIRLNSLIYFISGGNVYIHSLLFSFFSLLGIRELYLAFSDRIVFSKRLFWYLIILLPSVLFWTGSILKEPLMIAGVCLLLRAVFGRLTSSKRAWRWVLGLLLILGFKPYVLFCLLPPLLIYLVSRKVFHRQFGWTLLGAAGLAVIALLILPQQREKAVFHLTRKQYDFVNIGKGGLHAYADSCFFFFRPDQYKYLTIIRSDSSVYLNYPLTAKQVTRGKALPFKDVALRPDGTRWINYFQAGGCVSYVPVTSIDNSFRQLIFNIPEAFVNAAFRPFFGDPGGQLKYMAIMETILLFGWLFWQLKNIRRVPEETRHIVLTLLLFAVLLLLLIGWITPVLGAIVRYRIPAYLAVFLASLLLYIPRKKTTP